jgi:nicotinate dehydrogenase subunit B
MLHARMLRGPHPSCRIESVDIDGLHALHGVTHVVRSGQFLAIAGPKEAQLVRALADAVKFVQWQLLEALAVQTDIAQMLPAMRCESAVVHAQGVAAPAVAMHKARYSRPYLAHAAIGPACALADLTDGHLTVWSHTQGPFFLRDQIARALGRNKNQVDVIHMPGAGCYGHNGADDAAFDAAFIAQCTGLPVRVQWMREDEMSASPFGSAGLTEIEAGVDADGHICEWNLQVWSHSHMKRPGWGDGVNLLGAWAIEPPLPESRNKDVSLPAGGGQRNSIALYAFTHQKVTYHFIEHSPIRVSALRSLGAYLNTFAIESFLDELATQIGADPVDFRLRHLNDSRARAAIQAVARISGWQSNMPGASGTGMGIGFGRYKNHAAYCAVVARVRVEEKIHVEKVWAAVDAGAIINPDGLINQIEGGIVQSMSWTLKEAVTWSPSAITSNTWDTYPILNFDEVPEIEVVLLDQPEQPSIGCGEAAAGPTAAAIGNAFAHALGLRARHLPLTAERLAQLINES